MNVVDEFLNIAPVAFEIIGKTTYENNLPFMFSQSSKVIKIRSYRDIYVICSDFKNPISVFQLYSYLKRKNPNTYVYLFRGFESNFKFEYKTIINHRVNCVNSRGDVVTYGDRNDSLKYVFDELIEDNRNSYTKNTQLVLKYYFLNRKQPYTVREISEKIRISPATIARSNEVLYQLGALEKNGYNTRGEYVLKNKREVLKLLKNHFIRPYESSYLLQIDKEQMNDERWLIAGQYAVSVITDLMPETNVPPTYAVYKRELSQLFNGNLNSNFIHRTNIVCVQSYIYDPTIFSKGKMIDIFDLYLTIFFECKSNNDPRLSAALKQAEGILLDE